MWWLWNWFIRNCSFQSARFIASFFEQAQISFRLLHFPWTMKSLTRRYLLHNVKSGHIRLLTSSAGFCCLMLFKNACEIVGLFWCFFLAISLRKSSPFKMDQWNLLQPVGEKVLFHPISGRIKSSGPFRTDLLFFTQVAWICFEFSFVLITLIIVVCHYFGFVRFRLL